MLNHRIRCIYLSCIWNMRPTSRRHYKSWSNISHNFLCIVDVVKLNRPWYVNHESQVHNSGTFLSRKKRSRIWRSWRSLLESGSSAKSGRNIGRDGRSGTRDTLPRSSTDSFNMASGRICGSFLSALSFSQKLPARPVSSQKKMQQFKETIRL